MQILKRPFLAQNLLLLSRSGTSQLYITANLESKDSFVQQLSWIIACFVYRYCNHLVKEEINTCVEHFLTDLARFQDRMYLKDPIKAKAKRRYVCGLREVLKHLKLKKLKCIILPPNLDRIQSEGWLIVINKYTVIMMRYFCRWN